MGPSRAVADSGPGLRAPGRARPRRDGQGAVVCAVSLGGGLGAAARYGAGLLWPTAGGAFPWTTFLVNTAGCALIGVLLTVIAGLPAPHRLLRPFLGTGVLGGFTTFSTYAVDVRRLAEDGRLPTAVAYCVGTPVAALAAVWAAAAATRRLTEGRTG